MRGTFTPPGGRFDPRQNLLTVDIHGGHGSIACAVIPADRWTKARRKGFLFRDRKGQIAGGITFGKFTRTRSGLIAFRLRSLAGQAGTVGRTVGVTLRLASSCWQGSALRTLQAR